MKKKRLLKLADMLSTVDPERFDMKDWVVVKGIDPVTMECRTAACAAGWACSIPEFREAGLSLRFNDKDRNWDIVFDGKQDLDALVVFFGITHDQAGELFLPKFYPDQKGNPSAAQVAERIRNMAA